MVESPGLHIFVETLVLMLVLRRQLNSFRRQESEVYISRELLDKTPRFESL